MNKRYLRWMAALASAALLLAACGNDTGTTTDPDDTDATEPGDTDATEPGDTEETDPDAAPDNGDFEGTSVSVFGAPTSVEADAINAVIQEFVNEPTGMDAFYEGSDSFEEQVLIRVEGGNPPDVALFPQPGAVIRQAEEGQIISLEQLGFDIDELKATFGDYLIELGEYEGEHYAVPTNANLKSLIWYNIPVFEAQGYEIPETFEDLLTLSDQMLADGYTPWSIGTGSDAATGWPATDWLEDIVLRQQGTDVYDGWVDNSVPFDGPEIQEAMDLFGQIVFADGYVLGGPDSIPAIDFRDAPDAIIGDEPPALMHRQASFIVNFFPEGAEFGTDYGVFPFPTIDGNDGALMAGELAVFYADRPEVEEFVRRFTDTEAQCAGGNFEGVARISPNINTTADCYVDEVVATSAETVIAALEAGTARFDASDLMPPAVGSGSFWTGMNEWMRGADTDAVLAEIESAW
jgi:alpha-glucoside transport system substrate-binding protein